MRHQMEQLQQLMEQQQKLIKLLSLPMANQGFTLPIGFSSPLTGLSAVLSPGINTTAFQFSGPSANENSSNAKGSFCIPLVQIIQSPAQESASTSLISSDPTQTAMYPPPPQDSGDSMAENSILVQHSSNEKPEIHVSRLQLQMEEAETTLDECIPEDENCPRNLSPINEEKGELQLEQHAVTPFGIQRNSKKPEGLEERPIRPGISEKEKTFEDFVEELLKVDSELIQQDPQDINEVKVAPKKTFLKRGEGIARFEKNKENILKEENRSPVCKSTKQFPKKVSFSSQHRFSLPLLNENKKHQNKKQLISKKQIDSSELVESKAMKSVCIDNSLEETKIKDHTLKEKLDEIKNSTDEGIQSDINVAEPPIKVESPHKYSDRRKSGCHHVQQDSQEEDITTLEESQGRTSKGSLNINALENQHLMGVDSQLKNCPNSFSHESMERQNQGQQIGQIKMNQLQESSNELPYFNNVSHLECLSNKRTENIDQTTNLDQQQAEKAQNEDIANDTDSKKFLDRISPSIGFKRINDKIIQVATDGLLCQSANFGNQQIKDHDMDSFGTTGLVPLANNEHSLGFVLKNNSLSCGASNAETDSTDNEDVCPKSQYHTHPMKEILQTSGQTDKNLDLSDDVDYASDAPKDDQSRQLQVKLLQLETEIERFKVENTALAKMKEKQELAMESLRKRMDQFEHEKIEEIARLDEYKKEEMKKLQKAKQLSEKHSATRAIFDKKENEEMEFLKHQLSQLQEDFRKNESKWSHAHKCLRNQIDTLTKENIELRDELKAVDCHRQEPMKKTEISKKFETPVSDAIIKGTSQRVSCRQRSRSSTPTGRRMPVERRLTPVDSELKLSGKLTKRPENRKIEVREIHTRSPVHLRSRSGTPTGWKTSFQDRSTPDPALNIQQCTPNRQRGRERKSPAPSVNLSVFQRLNSTSCTRGVQSSNSGSSEDNSCMHLQTTERVSRSQNNTPKRQIQETQTLNQSSALRSQERPPSGCRSRSATPRGRKTPLDSF
ncbi:hypothetical protein chiPu_0008744, partial [Chiloscyllium punctatum]|nr:hypothetical protein [Chiloscyllium punctatum]